jgi:hypothetical protein
MPCSTLAEVLQFEKWLDEGTRDAMVNQGIQPQGGYFLQFSSDTELTPRIEIKSIPGEVDQGRQCYILPDGVRTIFNTFLGQLQVTVVTNRGQKQQHTEWCGIVRAALQPVSLRLGWQGAPVDPVTNPSVWTSQVVTLTDIYLGGESQSIPDDEHNLDKTMIPFNILFNVLDTAWPLNM